MKIYLFLFLLISYCFSPLFSQLENNSKIDLENYNQKELFVKLKCKLSKFEKITGYKGRFIRTFKHINTEEVSSIFSIAFKTNEASLKFYNKYKDSSKLIDYIEFKPIHKTSYTPNDYSSKLWYLDKIKAPNAWEEIRGSSQIFVAIIDDAVDINHPDLKAVCVKNTGEIPNNGLDDDNNGYWDDYDGWGAHYLSPEVRPFQTKQNDFTHGTHCAGIAAGHTENNTGIASIGFGIKILPVSCSDSTLPGYIINGYEGIEYAIIRGVDIISLSWGGLGKSMTGQMIINHAYNQGILIIAAAGNNNSSKKMYPAAYDHVIAVAATDQSDRKAYFSNYGSWVDISAPGVNMYSTVSGAGYKILSGTSMATPLVAGLCGLMKSRNLLLTPDGLESCLKNSAVNISNINSLYNGQLGSGLIDAEAAVKCVKHITAKFQATKRYICPGQTVQFQNKSSSSASSYTWYFEGGSPMVSTVKNPIITYNNSGTFEVKLLSTDGNYSDSVSIDSYIKVEPPIAILSGQQKARINETIYLKATFTGSPPFHLDISDGTSKYSFPNLYTNPSYLPIPVTKKSIFHINYYKDSRCDGQYLGMGFVDTSETYLSGLCKYPIDIFTIRLKGSKEALPHELIKLKDGNILIAGIQSNSHIGGHDIFLTKVDAKGKLIWSKLYGTKNTEYGNPVSIAECSNGIYLGASMQPSGSWFTGYISKLENNGDIKWGKLFQNPKSNDIIRGLSVLDNDDVIASGTSGINKYQAGQIIRFNKDGAKKWGFSRDVSSKADHFTNSILINNSIYAFGHSNYGEGEMTSWVLKTNIDGDIIWRKDVDLPWFDACFSGIGTPDNASIVLQGNMGWTKSSRFGKRDFSIAKIDTNGNIIWSKTLGTPYDDFSTNITFLNGFYFIAGITQGFIANNPLPFLIKFDESGNISWQKVYGRSTNSYNLLLTARCLINIEGGIMLALLDTKNGKHIALFKFNQCGETLCESEKVSFSIDNKIPKISNSRGTENFILSEQNYNLTSIANSSSIQTIDICPPKNTEKRECEIISSISQSLSCISDTLVLKDLSFEKNGKKIISRIWQMDNDTAISSGAIFKYRLNQTGSYLVKLIVTSDTPNLCRDTISLTINSNNRIKGLIQASPITICKGDSSTLMARIKCGVAPINVMWSSGSFSSKSIMAKVSPQDNRWYIFTAIDKNGDLYIDSILVNVDKTCCKHKAKFQFAKKYACIGDSIYIINSTNSSSSFYTWDYFFNDVGFKSYSGTTPPPFSSNKIGIFKVRLIASGNCKSDTLIQEIESHNEPPLKCNLDTSFCNPEVFKFSATPLEGIKYYWTPNIGIDNNLIINPVITAANSIQYTVNAEDMRTGCIHIDTVNILVAKKPSLPNDTAICQGAILKIIGPSHGKFFWENNSKSDPRVISNSGVYTITDTQTFCHKSNSFKVTIKPSPVFHLDSLGFICDNQILMLDPNIDTSGLNANWSDGFPSFRRFVSEGGVFALTINDSSCSWADSIKINKITSPTAFIGMDTSICVGSNILLKAESQVANYQWHNESADSIFLVKTPGVYWLVAKNLCGKDSQSIDISFKKCNCTIYAPNVFSPNNNKRNEVFIQISDCDIRDYTLRIYNRWGEKLHETNDQEKGWNGCYMGKSCHEGVYIYQITGIMEYGTYHKILNKKGVLHLFR